MRTRHLDNPDQPFPMTPIHLATKSLPLAFVLSVLPAATLAQGNLFDLTPPAGEPYQAVASAGDVNADGVNDILVGAPHSFSAVHFGRVLIHSGVDGSVLQVIDGSPSANQGSDGHALFGFSVCGLGDLNGDGHSDYAIGCAGHKVAGVLTGAVHVHSGADGSELHTSPGQAVTSSDQFGLRLYPADDRNSDGFNDLYVWAKSAQVLYLISAADGSILQQQSLAFSSVVLGDLNQDGFPEWEDVVDHVQNPTVTIRSGVDGTVFFQGAGPAGSQFGRIVGGIGDQDGDGWRDYFIGQPNTGIAGAFGKLRIYSSATGQVLRTYVSDLADVDFGWATIVAGDVDGDGIEDLAIGSRSFDAGGISNVGRVQIYASADGALLSTQVGSTQAEFFGEAMVALGDIDGDAAGDLGVLTKQNGSGNPAHVQVFTLLEHLGGQYCSGSLQACPCGNDGGSAGCKNSSGGSARLFAHGSTSVASDNLTIDALQLPAQKPALLFAGDQGSAGTPFGDGLLCVGGGIQRLGIVFTGDAGMANWGPGIASSAGWNPGDQRFLQVWYRDPAGPCGAGFNTSNGLALTLAN